MMEWSCHQKPGGKLTFAEMSCQENKWQIRYVHALDDYGTFAASLPVNNQSYELKRNKRYIYAVHFISIYYIDVHIRLI